jgi:hypothetical protein
MKIDLEKIKRDLTTSKKALFLLEFPELANEINDVATKPYSNMLVKDFQNKLLDTENLNTKLQHIYGGEIDEVDLSYNFVAKGLFLVLLY